MNPNRTLAFETPYRHHNTVPWRYTQQQMNVIHHRVAFQQFNPLLTAQLPKHALKRMPDKGPLRELAGV
jgi:hypothetical protein